MACPSLTLPFLVVAALTVAMPPALAGDVGSPSSDIPLGAIPHYPDEASAGAGCRPDAVVWADRRSGFFYPKFHPDYGKTNAGTFTCYEQAKKADYWSLVPDSLGGHKGREFPRSFCVTCS